MAAGILAMALAAPGFPVRAAEPSMFKMSGSIRIRQESLSGQYRPGLPDEDDMLAIRSSLLAEWSRGSWKVVGELSDSRAYENGDGGVLSANEVNAFEPVQAYVAREFKAPFGAGSSATVQAGRMLLNIGSRRLVASDDFRNTPQGSTGVRADLKLASKLQWTAFYVLPQQRRPDDLPSLRDNQVKLDHEGRDQQLWGVVGAKPGLLPGGGTFEVSYIGFQEADRGARPTRNRALDNLGLRAFRDSAAGKADYEFEVIRQSGHLRASTAANAATLDVDAWFARARAGYTFDRPGKPRLAFEYDYASGDGTGANYGRFDTLFGFRRSDLAPSGIYGLLGRANIESVGLRFEMAPSARYDVMATWRAAWAANRHDSFSTSGIRDASGSSGSYAGQQLDARLRYWLVPQRLRSELTGVWFLRDGLLRDAPNASPHGDTKYVALALTLTF